VRLRVDLAVTVPKDTEHRDLNEDAWAVDESIAKVALSDGASESFDSRTWARMLVGAYVENASFSPEWLDTVLASYLAAVDYESLSWSKQAAFDRGSFATLLGLELAPNGTDVEVLAVGDSVAFHLRGEHLLASFPYTTAEEFDARPLLLSTVAASNAFVRDRGFFGRNTSRTWRAEPGDAVLLATDAVSQWALRERGAELDALSYLRSVGSAADFEAKVLELRRDSRIRVDDSTLVRLVVEN
jgi:hypothetical protein